MNRADFLKALAAIPFAGPIVERMAERAPALPAPRLAEAPLGLGGARTIISIDGRLYPVQSASMNIIGQALNVGAVLVGDGGAELEVDIEADARLLSWAAGLDLGQELKRLDINAAGKHFECLAPVVRMLLFPGYRDPAVGTRILSLGFYTPGGMVTVVDPYDPGGLMRIELETGL